MGPDKDFVSPVLVHYCSQQICCSASRVRSYKGQLRVVELAVHKVEPHCQTDCSYHESRKRQNIK